MAVALLFAVFGYTSVAKAQGTPALELYGGYDYVRYNANPKISGVPPSESFNANGVSGQIAYNPNNWLGLAAEHSGYALARQGFATTHQISYLFGPTINVRRGKITPAALFAPFVGSSSSSLPSAVFPHAAVGLGP